MSASWQQPASRGRTSHDLHHPHCNEHLSCLPAVQAGKTHTPASPSVVRGDPWVSVPAELEVVPRPTPSLIGEGVGKDAQRQTEDCDNARQRRYGRTWLVASTYPNTGRAGDGSFRAKPVAKKTLLHIPEKRKARQHFPS